MRVFGIDCGSNCTGYGVVDVQYGPRETRLTAVAAGGLKLAKDQPLPMRLAYIFAELSALLELHRPEVVAVEEVFYSVNAKSALKLGHVRGVALLAAATHGLPVAEYAPLTIKSAVVGYGLAQKEQVQFMVARLLNLDCAPEPADAADALAIAICHVHTAQTLFCRRHPALEVSLSLLRSMVWAVLPLVIAPGANPAAAAGPRRNRPWLRSALLMKIPSCSPRSMSVTVARMVTGISARKRAAPRRLTAKAMPAEAQDRPIHISKAVRESMFATARKSKLFAIACDDGAKNIAYQGTKTLAYEGPEGKGRCTYNWSKLSQIDKLTDQFEAIAATLDEGSRLQRQYEHGRLSLDSELEPWTTWCRMGGRSKLENIAPLLRTIAGDDAVLQRVQRRARALLQAAKED